jgi:methylisocitrate lyase
MPEGFRANLQRGSEAFVISPGERFWAALEAERPLQVVGAVNAYCARLAERAGFKALYLSGAGVANASFALPDLGVTNLTDVCEDARRVCGVTQLPLLIDADTGFGTALNVRRTVRELERAGAAGLHLEDQVAAKRCGHRPNKALVAAAEMVDRVKAAVDARVDGKFVVMARTDAAASEGLAGAIDRANQYVAAGADMVFAEAMTSVSDCVEFVAAVAAPVLVNVTEFGVSPLFTTDELQGAGVRLALYPLSAFRAMSRAAERVYGAIRDEGSQRGVVDAMQTRDELYDVLWYHEYEEILNRLFGRE